MAKLLFRLRNVPDDEADEVRALLSENGFEYHETSGGFLGIGTAAIWLADQSRYDAAKALIDDYEERRAKDARARFERLKRQGRNRSLVDLVRDDPLQFVVYLAIAAGLIYLTVVPFFKLAKG